MGGHKSQFNYLSAKVTQILEAGPRGAILDLGCGNGDSSVKLKEMGFNVTAADMDAARFGFHGQIPFKVCDLNQPFPFPDHSFDKVIFLEVIEHIYNPQAVIGEISRVLKPGGTLILSTPNILNLGSRFRFLFEGAFDFFREPILDYHRVFPMALQNMHVVVWRYHELEYLLFRNALEVKGIHTDSIKGSLRFWAFFWKPFFRLQGILKERRASGKKGVDFKRIHKLVLSDELLLGKHLIIQAVKTS